ncbi:MAG: hypothetical protein JWM59_3988 [Verrucomicrobiales bacterium]|nr:hypothetical protein [Verrucomicrobiales bacterium]
MATLHSRQSAVLPPHLSRTPREENNYRPDDTDFEGGELIIPGDALATAGEDLEERVQTTQNRLAQLRIEADALEREKQQFEELSRQQKEFMQGRADMGDKLTRAVAQLDRETYEAQKRVEQMLIIKDKFNQQLDVIDSLNPEQWNPHDLRHDLSRALSMIQDAKDEFISGSARIQQLTMGAAGVPAVSGPVAAAGPTVVESCFERPSAVTQVMGFNRDTFQHWLFCGLAFTTPVIAITLLVLIIWLVAR